MTARNLSSLNHKWFRTETSRAVIDRAFYVVPACQPPNCSVFRHSFFLSQAEERELLSIESCSRSEVDVHDAPRGTSKRRVAGSDHGHRPSEGDSAFRSPDFGFCMDRLLF